MAPILQFESVRRFSCYRERKILWLIKYRTEWLSVACFNEPPTQIIFWTTEKDARLISTERQINDLLFKKA